MTLYGAFAERYCSLVVKSEGAIKEEALDILHERITRLKSETIKIDLARVILLLTLLLYSFGIVLKISLQGAEIQLSAQMRDVLLLLAVTLTLYSNFASFLSSALYAALKLGMEIADISISRRYKYLSQPDLFGELIFNKETRSLFYLLSMLAISLVYIAHLVAFLAFDVGAYIYLAQRVKAHPAFGALSLLLANYTLAMVWSIFLITLVFHLGRFRFVNQRYVHLEKKKSRYQLMFFKKTFRNRIAAGSMDSVS